MPSAYDQLPYQSAPVAETHPDHLAAVAVVCGLNPPPPHSARVLELGCAEGGNLVPMAWQYPEASWLGIDLSPRQIDLGRALAAELGLGNLRLEVADAAALTPAVWGRFDYILAHGLFSWVPPEVGEGILAGIAACLAPGGLAYVSYNTLPGWRLRGVVRDLLGASDIPEAASAERLARARHALAALQQALGGRADPYALLVGGEAARLRELPDAYLFHEYLAPHNHALLFQEFVALARRHGLAYVGEVGCGELLADGESDQPLAAAAALARAQWLDFERNRMFRQSLLCRLEEAPRQPPDPLRVERLALHAELWPQGGVAVDWRRAKGQPYQNREGRRWTVHHPLTKAALRVLAERFPDSLPLGAVIEAGAALLAGQQGRAAGEDAAHAWAELTSLALLGGVRLAPEAHRYSPPEGEAPRITPLVRALLARGARYLPTVRQQVLAVDPWLAELAPRLDGERSLGEVNAQLTALVLAEPGTWWPLLGGRGKPFEAAVARRVGEESRRWLALLGRQGLLEGLARQPHG